MAYAPNPGFMPDDCIVFDEDGNVAGYIAVHVRLFGGFDTRKSGHAPWPAKGGRPADTNWRIGRPPHFADIKEWEAA